MTMTTKDLPDIPKPKFISPSVAVVGLARKAVKVSDVKGVYNLYTRGFYNGEHVDLQLLRVDQTFCQEEEV